MASDKAVVLITGANQGVGFEAAKALAASSGSYHILIGSRDTSRGDKAVEELNKISSNSSISTIQLEVTSSDSIKAAAASVESEFGKLDCLINNAGRVSASKDLETQLRENFEVNVFGATLVAEAFIPLLKKSQASTKRLIHVTSDLGSLRLAEDPNWKYYHVPSLTYRMTKAALNMLAVRQAISLKDDGIKVFAYNPGWVVTVSLLCT